MVSSIDTGCVSKRPTDDTLLTIHVFILESQARSCAVEVECTCSARLFVSKGFTGTRVEADTRTPSSVVIPDSNYSTAR